MPTIYIQNLSEEEKHRLDVARAKSRSKTWKDFMFKLVEMYESETTKNGGPARKWG